MKYQFDNLIIGSSGFIGNSLSEILSNSQTMNIRSRIDFDNFLEMTSAKSFEFKNVFWTAGVATPANSPSGPVTDMHDYISLQAFLLRYRWQIEKFVYLSSGGCVYGPGSGPFNEESKTIPNTQYGRLKIACEALVSNMVDVGIILRTSNVFGKGQNPKRFQGVIPYWIENVKLKKPIQVFGPLESYRDYISIESLLKALIRVTSLNSSEVINIGSGEKTSLGDLLDIFIKSFKDFFEIQYLPARSSDRLSYSLDVNKSIKLLGQYHIPPVIDLLNEFISNELGKFNLKNPG